MPDDCDVKFVPIESNVGEIIQRLLSSEDPVDKPQYEQHQKSNALSEVELLWYGVLELGLSDYKQNLLATHAPGKNIFSEVFDWFFNAYLKSIHIGSFENICLNLNINSSVIIKKLIIWTRKAYNEKNKNICLQEGIKQITITLYVNKKDII